MIMVDPETLFVRVDPETSIVRVDPDPLAPVLCGEIRTHRDTDFFRTHGRNHLQAMERPQGKASMVTS